jgi:hypothetical protein
MYTQDDGILTGSLVAILIGSYMALAGMLLNNGFVIASGISITTLSGIFNAIRLVR